MTTVRPRTAVSWSSGKDAAWTLHVLQQGGETEVVSLFTTTDRESGMVGMHGVGRDLLDAQAAAAGLPLHAQSLPWPCQNDVYETSVRTSLNELRRRLGITHIAFGDLYLDDVREYRLKLLSGTGLTPLFPLWARPTAQLARDMLAAGLEAVVTCVDPARLSPTFAGRAYDEDLLQSLPGDVDPCGEAGEFHTFASGGPMFRRRIPVTVGPTVHRGGFLYADIGRATPAVPA